MLSRQDLKQLGSDSGRGNPVCMDAKLFTPPCPRWLGEQAARAARPASGVGTFRTPTRAGWLLSREP